MKPSAVVLAGGLSRRMGTDKALAHFEGEPLLRRVVRLMTELCDDVVVVTGRDKEYAPVLHDLTGIRFVADVIPEKGALGGIYSGLLAATSDVALVVACDMPFLNRELLDHLARLASEFDAVVPRIAGHAEPTHAAYRKDCLDPIRKLLSLPTVPRIIRFLPEVRARFVDEDEIARFDRDHRSFINLNTPAEVEGARRMLQDSA